MTRMPSSAEYLSKKSETTMRLGLDVFHAWLRHYARPDQTLPIILVGGTNGKGSTCAFLAQMLRAHGARVGLNTSPHLYTPHERIAINQVPISEEDLASLLRELDAHTSQVGLPDLSYFEALTLSALLHFARSSLDYAVFEVGLGGRLDATQALHRRAVGISAIGYDHSDILGPTLSHIAREKAPLFLHGQHKVLGPQPYTEALSAVQAFCTQETLNVRQASKDYTYTFDEESFTFSNERVTLGPTRLGLKGEHQAGNAALACDLFSQSFDGPVQTNLMAKGLTQTRLAGRLETWRHRRIPNRICLDVAHNLDSISTLLATLSQQDQLPDAVVIGMAANKDWPGVLRKLLTLDAPLYAVPLSSSRSWNVSDVCRAFPKIKALDAVSPAQLREALSQFGHPLVTGSFYLVGPLRHSLIASKEYDLETP